MDAPSGVHAGSQWSPPAPSPGRVSPPLPTSMALRTTRRGFPMGPMMYATSLPSGEITGWNSRPGLLVTWVMFEVVICSVSRPSQPLDRTNIVPAMMTALPRSIGTTTRHSLRDPEDRGMSSVAGTSTCAAGVVANTAACSACPSCEAVAYRSAGILARARAIT